MLVTLAPTITADIVFGPPLSINPRWMLDGPYVDVGPYSSMAEHEHHILQMVGSFNWYRGDFDELCFDRQELLLQSAWFRVPEVNVTDPTAFAAWQPLPPTLGRLQLTTVQGFNVEPADIRWMDAQGSLLICATEAALSTPAAKLRLQVAPKLDLLFADQTLCGWALAQPSRYLVSSWNDAIPGAADSQLAELVSRYLWLLDETGIEQMQAQDPAIRQALAHLHTQIDPEDGAVQQRIVLRQAIEDVVDRFYDQA